MPISQEAKIIANKIYRMYGSDSGYLFGILPERRNSVEAVVQATIEVFMNEK